MRVTIALLTLTALVGCGGVDANKTPAETCAEQALWAQSGTTDPHPIRITCPENDL